MKKLVLAIAVVASFASCEKQADVVGTGSVGFTPIVENATAIGKKGGVERGDIPVYIKAINVTAQNGSQVNEFNYELTDGAGDPTDFVMTGLPLGYTSFDAVTTPADMSKFAKTKFTFGVNLKSELEAIIATDRFQDWLAAHSEFGEVIADLENDNAAKAIAAYIKNKMYRTANPEADKDTYSPWSIAESGFTPYAVYTGSTQHSVLDANDGTPDNIQFNLTTNNGREMITFRPETVKSLENVWVRISIVANGKTYTNVMTSEALVGAFYWSDEFAVDGAAIDIKLEWLDAGSPEAKVLITEAIGTHTESKWTKHFFGTKADLPVLKTATIDGIQVDKGFSTWTDVKLTADSFVAEDQTAVFTVEEIVDNQDHIEI